MTEKKRGVYLLAQACTYCILPILVHPIPYEDKLYLINYYVYLVGVKMNKHLSFVRHLIVELW